MQEFFKSGNTIASGGDFMGGKTLDQFESLRKAKKNGNLTVSPANPTEKKSITDRKTDKQKKANY